MYRVHRVLVLLHFLSAVPHLAFLIYHHPTPYLSYYQDFILRPLQVLISTQGLGKVWRYEHTALFFGGGRAILMEDCQIRRLYGECSDWEDQAKARFRC